MSTILLTGSAGFVGSITAQQLLAHGHRVIGVDNLNDYYDVRLKEHRLSLVSDNPHFTFRKIDIENRTDVRSLFNEYKFDSDRKSVV